MVTAVVESPLRQRQRQRLRSPLAGAGTGSTAVNGEDLEIRNLRPAKRASVSGGGMRRRWAPPQIEIPTTNGGGGRGYTSLRDIIMSSSPTAKAAISPDEPPGGGAGGAAVVVAGDVHMIRHPLVKHAAYAYLQLTPAARVQRRRGGPLGRLFLGCLGFLGALFGR